VKTLFAICLAGWLPLQAQSLVDSTAAAGQAKRPPMDTSGGPSAVQGNPMDSLATRPVKDSAPAPPTPVAATPAPAPHPAPPTAPKGVEPKDRKFPGIWQLTLDFADITDSGLMNERHLHQTDDQTNLCCLDLAWLPLRLGTDRFQAGAFGNLGGWHQILTDGSAVTVGDLSLGGSLLGSVPFDTTWLGWARVDLGVSNLLVQRHTTGMDWGMASAFRFGIAFPFWGHLGFFGGGVDFRDYWHLDVHEVPGLTLFLGEWI